jgi:hypothetical protein
MHRTDVDLQEAYETIRTIKTLAKDEGYPIRILSVGNTQPLNIATHVVHTNKLEERLKNAKYKKLDDLSDNWAYKKPFDFVVCVDTLQEVRDPIAVIKQMSNVGRKGFIRVIDRSFESLKGAESDDYAGFANHRWFVESTPKKLKFTFKHPYIHFISEYMPPMSGVKHLNIWWDNDVQAFEKILHTDEEVRKDFLDYLK